MRLLQRLRHHVAQRECEMRAVIARSRRPGTSGSGALTASSNTARLGPMERPNGSSSVMVALSPMPNSTRPLLTRSSTATRSATRAGWLVVSWMMPWPSRMFLVRWLAAARKRLGRRRMRVFLQEMVLDQPGMVVAQPVGELELGERVLVELVLAALLPGPRQLQLVENAEFHPRRLSRDRRVIWHSVFQGEALSPAVKPFRVAEGGLYYGRRNG